MEGQDLDMSVYSYYTENTANGESSGAATNPANLLLTGMSEEVKFDNINGAVLNTEGPARNDAQIYADLESCGPT